MKIDNKMKIYVARHGRTNYNDLGLCNADPSVGVHLTPIGVEQAKTLAGKLSHTRIDHIFVSELQRTLQTAEIVNTFHRVKVEADSRLNDGRSGFEGKPFEEYEKALSAASNRWTVRFNDGESIEDIKVRVAGFIGDLRAKNYASVLIVTSLWIIQAMVAILQNLTNEQAWGLEVSQGNCMELEI